MKVKLNIKNRYAWEDSRVFASKVASYGAALRSIERIVLGHKMSLPGRSIVNLGKKIRIFLEKKYPQNRSKIDVLGVDIYTVESGMVDLLEKH